MTDAWNVVYVCRQCGQLCYVGSTQDVPLDKVRSKFIRWPDVDAPVCPHCDRPGSGPFIDLREPIRQSMWQ